MKYWILLFILIRAAVPGSSFGQSPGSDTLTGRVCEWNHLQELGSPLAQGRLVLSGETHDLSALDIRANTLPGGGSWQQTIPRDNPSDQLLIVKEGTITVSCSGKAKILGPGGVGLFTASDQVNITNTGKTDATFYILLFHSRKGENKQQTQKSGDPFLVDWPDMTMKKTDKGESRQIFDQPMPQLKRIDMHATTLDPGQISHPPHVHRAEEIILMRSGHVKAFIGDKYHDASGGDLIFFPSGVPHNVENKSNERCEYFALQWEN